MRLLSVALILFYCRIDAQHYVPAYAELQNSDYNFPMLGFGTAAMGGRGFESVVSAVETGVQMTDTAQAREWYDEASVGKALRHLKSTHGDSLPKIVTVTKLHPRSFEQTKMNAAIDASLDNLASGSARTLDVVLLHSPWCWRGHCTAEEERVSWRTGWRNLEAQKRAGRVHIIGVCNFEAHLLQELIDMADAKVGVIQVGIFTHGNTYGNYSYDCSLLLIDALSY